LPLAVPCSPPSSPLESSLAANSLRSAGPTLSPAEGHADELFRRTRRSLESIRGVAQYEIAARPACPVRLVPSRIFFSFRLTRESGKRARRPRFGALSSAARSSTALRLGTRPLAHADRAPDCARATPSSVEATLRPRVFRWDTKVDMSDRPAISPGMSVLISTS